MPNIIFIFQQEIKRTFFMSRRYWLDNIAYVAMIYLIYMALYIGISHTKMLPVELINFLPIGYLLWAIFAHSSIIVISYQLMEDSACGILEQLYLSPAGIIKILSLRVLAEIVKRGIFLFIFILLIFITTGKIIKCEPILIIPFLLILIGLYGMGFICAAVAIIFKRIHLLLNLVFWILFVLSGVVLPLEYTPRIAQISGQLLPLTQGLKVIQLIVVKKYSLRDTLISGDLLFLILNSSIYLILGILIFKLADRFARQQGIIGHY